MSTISPEREKKLRKLVQMMNTRHKEPFPVNADLLSCFDIAIAPDELDFLLKFGMDTLSSAQAMSLSGMPEEQFRPFFDGIIRKGMIEEGEAEDQYMLRGILFGWFEMYLCGGLETPERQEFARRFDKLLKGFGKMNVLPLRLLFNHKAKRRKPAQSIVAGPPDGSPATRRISVNQTIPTAPMQVYPSSNVFDLIEKHGEAGQIAVVHCFCRQAHKMVNEPCKFNHRPQSCVVLGSMTDMVVRHGYGRKITKAEALDLIHEVQQKGAVHQVFHRDEDADRPEFAICNCCWDCCGVLGSYNRAILPLVVRSHYIADVPEESVCTECGVCADYCPVQAITVPNGGAAVNEALCIGCGQCELHCPEHAISLYEKERTVVLPLKKRSEARIPW
jgi:ferredoxin